MKKIFRALDKLFISPFIYKTQAGYDEERFWRDRYIKHGVGLKGAGHEGISEEQNLNNYRSIQEQILSVIREAKIDSNGLSLLDVGCGNGFLGLTLVKSGIKHYTGIDITDVLFETLRKTFPSQVSHFDRIDISREKIPTTYNVILAIDVLGHIVNDKLFAFALNNLTQATQPKGIVIIAPVFPVSKSHLFYNRKYSVDDFAPYFAGWKPLGPIPFRDSQSLIAFQKP